MPDFQYQPPTGPLSGSEFERQTTRFFQQVQGAADAAQSTAIIAQNTANEALERSAASNLVDGKTTRADAGGTITVKDVAIGGNLGDLASARGFFYDTYLPYYPGRGSNPVDDFNLLTLPGTYHIVVSRDTLNRPNVSLFTGSGTNDGILEITMISPASTVSSYQRLKQRFTVFGSDTKTWSRNQDTNATTWYAWEQEIRTGDIGDGIRVTNGTISVPEYEGATASTAGTSGLVPPATAGQQESFLTGGGEYKPALTKISDSVSLADSAAAASAKAVKTAYDLANSKQANLGFTPVQQGGGAGQEGQKIYIGWSPSGLKAQADALNLGNIVTTSAGCTKAPSAANADRLRLTEGGETAWSWTGQGGQPGWLWGGNDGVNMYVYNPSNFSVNYANSAGSALIAAPAVQWVVNLSGPQITVPPGGTYNVVCICFNDSGGKGAVKHYPNTAGGTVIPNAPTDYFVAGLCARVA